MVSMVSSALTLVNTQTCYINPNEFNKLLYYYLYNIIIFLFTCKRSDSVMSECSSRTEVSKSMLVLLTTALLRLPPVLFAMTCSDSCRSCDSSGMSRRMKTTSNRDRRAEPILQSRRAVLSSSSNSVKKNKKKFPMHRVSATHFRFSETVFPRL